MIHWKSCLSGCITISAPTRPPASNNQRKRDTRSPMARTDTSVMTMGVSVRIAVNSATGM